jgi:hypothetical protein
MTFQLPIGSLTLRPGVRYRLAGGLPWAPPGRAPPTPEV